MIALLLDHLWQSSLCVGGARLLALALHRNGANARFWLWFAASIKFLVPFAALTAIGAYFLTPIIPPVAAPIVTLMEPLAKPFSAPATILVTTGLTAAPAALPTLAAPTTAHLDLVSALSALWAVGFLIIVLRWLVRWSRVRAILRDAVEAQVYAPVVVKYARSRLVPGLVGILRPVVLLPQGIEQRLSPAELQAVLAHELCHWRRHDNLLAAIHMLVEALFWFFPLVWWLGVRLDTERERACDESVLADGNNPLVYADGILKVCRAYLQSPLACVAGVSGAGLKRRMDTIMENRPVHDVEGAKSALLISVAVLSVMLPLLAGGLGSGPVRHIASRVASALAAQTAQFSLPAATAPDVRTAQRKPSRHHARRQAAFVPPAIVEPIVPDDAKIMATAQLPPRVDVQQAPADVPASAQALRDDSTSIVCRLPQQLPASRFLGPRVCRNKSEWAQLRAQGKDIGADGRTIVAAGGEKYSSIYRQACLPGIVASYSNVGIMCF